MKYDSVYPTFRLARQARSRLGGKLLRNHLAAMPALWMRFDHWPRTSPQAGARCTPRLDRGSARSLPWLREDLHLPPAVFSPLYSLQFADARSGIAAAPVEHCSWEEATPTLKDPNRVPDASTLRRWARGLDHSQPAFSFLRQTLSNIAHWLVLGHSADPRAGPLSSLHSVLPILWPLRL
jgi:hypothetical protein